MALTLAPRAEFLKDTQTIRIVDASDYVGEAIDPADVRGILTITDPNLIDIVDNADFDNPDIDGAVSLTSGEYALNLDAGEIVTGNYEIKYSVDTDADDIADYTITINVTYSEDAIPTVSISVVSSLVYGTISSSDVTDYSAVTLDTRTHSITFPASKGSIIDSAVGSNENISSLLLYIGDNIAEVTSGIIVKVSSENWIYATITDSVTHEVADSSNISGIRESYQTFYDRYEDALEGNRRSLIELQPAKEKIDESYNLWALNTLTGNPDEATIYVDNIIEILNTVDIPTDPVVPDGTLVNQVLPGFATQWLDGSGVPSSSLGRDGDYYFRIDTNGVYSKILGAWGSPIATLGTHYTFFGNVTNAPDEEDITEDVNVLKFKNRDSGTNTLGYKIIRQDFDFENIPVGYDNCIWEIRYEHDLDSANITLPINVTLKFNGGFITNYGIITGNETKIRSDILEIFDTSGTFTGSWRIDNILGFWFGAIGNDTLDETIAINKALSLAGLSLSGSKVSILDGIHLITDTIEIPSNVELNLTKLATIKLDDTIGDKEIIRNLDTIGGNSNISMIGGTIDGNIDNQAGGSNVGIRFEMCTNLYVCNVEILNMSKIDDSNSLSGFWFNKCIGTLVEQCIIHDCDYTGIQFSGGVTGTPLNTFKGINKILKCKVYDNDVSGIDSLRAENNILISMCDVYDNGLATNQISVNGQYSTVQLCNMWSDTGEINGGINIGDIGSAQSRAPYSIIENNYIYDAKIAIRCNSKNVKINGNQIFANGHDYGISINAVNNVSCDGNYINGSDLAAIWVQPGSSFAKINGNTTELTERNAIRLDGDNADIINNTVLNNNQGNTLNSSSAAIYNAGDNNKISGNIIDDDQVIKTTYYGIYNTSQQLVVVDDNIIRNIIFIAIDGTNRDSIIGRNFVNGRIEDWEKRISISFVKEIYSDITPTEGLFNIGDIIKKQAVVSAGYAASICTVAGMYGTLVGVTGSITIGTDQLTVNDSSDLGLGDRIQIAGVSGVKVISAEIVSNVITISSNADATVVGAAISYSTTPTFKDYQLIT